MLKTIIGKLKRKEKTLKLERIQCFFYFSSFKLKRLTQNPKLMAQIVKKFWLIYWGFIVKGLVRQWRLWTMSLLSSNILALLHFSLFHWVLSPSVYVTFLTFLWVLSLSLSRSTSLLLYLKKQTDKIDVNFFYT